MVGEDIATGVRILRNQCQSCWVVSTRCSTPDGKRECQYDEIWCELTEEGEAHSGETSN